MQFSLCSYTIRLKARSNRQNNSSQKYLKLDRLPNNQDFFDIIQDCFAQLANNNSIDDSDKNIIRVRRHEIDNQGRKIYGILEIGNYGNKKDIIDIETGDLSYQQLSKTIYLL